jgi:hypothetical protein
MEVFPVIEPCGNNISDVTLAVLPNRRKVVLDFPVVSKKNG